MQARRVFQGAFLALGAPLGWLAWRSAGHGVDPYLELAQNVDLYVYMTVGTILAFTLFALRVSDSERALKLANLDLSTMAVTDPLTGLRNVRFFDARFAEAAADAARGGGPLCLVLLDLDHFKSVNDTHGHPVGDEVLAAVAARIRDVVRASDTAARVGGEEFALLLPHVSLGAARATAERVRAAIQDEPISTNAGLLQQTISAGVAMLEIDGKDALYAAADAALYDAKHQGRNRVVVASGPEELAEDRAVG